MPLGPSSSSVLRHAARALALLLVSAAAPALAAQTIPIPDAALGLSQGDLAVLPGWVGQAMVDRTSDPFGGGTASLAVDVHSPDGSRGVRVLPIAFRTAMPGTLGFGPLRPGQPAAYVAFPSTADVLVRGILPLLNLPGKASEPFAIDRDKIAAIVAAQAASGTPQPFVDTAAVVVRDPASKQEILVEAVTRGMQRGTPNELTFTHVTLFRAPDGESRALHDAAARLPALVPAPAWVQADQALFERRMAAMRQQSQQAQAQNRASSDAAFENWKRSSAAQRASYDQHNAAWRRGQQQKSDSNALFAAHVGDHSVTYKWCNGGAVRYVTDSVQSPGAGWQRCS